MRTVATVIASGLLLAGCASGAAVSPSASPPHRALTAADASTSGPQAILGGAFGGLGGGRFGGVPHVVITGGIADRGTTGPATATGKPSQAGKYIKFTLSHGTFLATNIHDKTHFSKLSPQCTLTGVLTFDYVLSHGTGRYAGITGSLKTSVRIAEVHFKVTSGHDKGQCPSGPNQKGYYYTDLAAHGTVTL